MKGWLPVALGLCFALALLYRATELSQRPFHNDEAVNALKFKALYETGDYRYDPNEYHGPLLHYATLALAGITGWRSFEATSEANFRWLTVLVGAGLVPLLWFIRDALGRGGTACAALFTALSPSLTFYSRDFIHETLLVAATNLLIGCLWRFSRQPHWGWAALCGLAVALMHTTKETFVLNLSAMVAAFLLLRLWRGWEAGDSTKCQYGCPRNWLIGLIVWLAVAGTLLTSMGRNPSGLVDSFRAYLPWLGRAGQESVHAHSIWWYAQRMFWQDSGRLLPWTELSILVLALVAVWGAFWRRGLGDASSSFVRWLALNTFILFTIYSLIPYKTPWCILAASQGLVLLAGVGLAILWRLFWRPRARLILAGVTTLLLIQIAWQGWALSHSHTSARTNPWVYSDTVPDIRNLVQRIEDLSNVSDNGRATRIDVICEEEDYWPLPYYLRGHEKVGWWSSTDRGSDAPILIVSPAVLKSVQFPDSYVHTGNFQLRYGVFRACLVDRTLWQSYLTSRASN